MRFTAIKRDESNLTTSVEEKSLDESEIEQRIVFINNLPIDTSEEEIDQIYSRCGPLDSLQLFNLRPDLDPGLLTKKQLEERRRKNRLNNNTSSTYDPYQNNHRPRTPVYGMLTFQTAEGYKRATSPEMSLFGCVIRRHPVMSIKTRDAKTLYIEQIQPNMVSMEVEYKLARLFHPHQVYVMLDGLKGVGRGNGVGFIDKVEDYQDYSEPASCEVKFEDFQTCLNAYHWMRGDETDDGVMKPGCSATFMGGEDCQVHWFRTPQDKMKYWTRELNF